MGIVKKELSVFKLSDSRSCRIEENIGGEIHVHIGNIRIDITPAELEEFAEVLGTAREELHEKKGWN